MLLTFSLYHDSNNIFATYIFSQKNAKVVSIDDYEDAPVNDEKALQKAVANQPISVAIEGGGRDFQLYSSVTILFVLFIQASGKQLMFS